MPRRWLWVLHSKGGLEAGIGWSCRRGYAVLATAAVPQWVTARTTQLCLELSAHGLHCYELSSSCPTFVTPSSDSSSHINSTISQQAFLPNTLNLPRNPTPPHPTPPQQFFSWESHWSLLAVNPCLVQPLWREGKGKKPQALTI